MKKKILLIGLCLVTGVLISGCSGNKAKVTLGQYEGLEAEYTLAVVSDKMVEEAIISAVIANQEDVKITDRAVRKGDIANINFVGKVDGVAFEGGSAEGHELEIGLGSFIDGFEDGIIGMKIGQTKDIKVVFPDPYENNPDLAGAQAVFTVKVNSIKGKKLPKKVTDAMIKEISDTYTTVKDFRNYMREQLETQVEEANNKSKQNAVWDLVVANTTVDSLAKNKTKYYADLFDSYYEYYAQLNEVDLATIISDYLGLTQAEYDAEKKASSESSSKNCAIAQEIAKEQGFTVTDEDFQKYLEENSVTEEDEQEFNESIKDEILYQKVIEFIVSKTQYTIKK